MCLSGIDRFLFTHLTSPLTSSPPSSSTHSVLIADKTRKQCDEGQPHCRNCIKSKRGCGYDPVFKSQPGHPPIQPAPNAQQPPQTPTTASPYPQVPTGYMPAGSQSYSPGMSGGPSGVSSVPTEPRYTNTSPLIDPALEQANLPGATIGDSPLSTIGE